MTTGKKKRIRRRSKKRKRIKRSKNQMNQMPKRHDWMGPHDFKLG